MTTTAKKTETITHEVGRVTLEQAHATARIPQKVFEMLRENFGRAEFKPYQARAIGVNLETEDTFSILATGGGKSLTYQLPALYRHSRGLGITVVVSPLIALIIDQVLPLKDKGIVVACFSSFQTKEEARANMELVKSREACLLFVSPERFTNGEFQRSVLGTISKHPIKIAGIALDEAHTVTEWGHDFRPDLGTKLGEAIWRIGHLASQPVELPNKNGIGTRRRPVVQICTATASPQVRDDIVKTLDLGRQPIFIQGELDRANLVYSLRHFSSQADKVDALSEALARNRDGLTIVYCSKRKLTMDLCEHLEKRGIKAAYYHAGMTSEERIKTQEQFKAGGITTLIATTAFGMGIDKPNVRHVIHFNVPGSLEQYAQESGRAGRDGLPARCSLWVVPEDWYTQLRFISLANPDRDFIKKTYELLWNSFLDPEQKSLEVPVTSVDYRKFLAQDNKDLKAPRWYYILQQSSLAALQEYGILRINGYQTEFMVKPADFDSAFPDDQVLRAKKDRAMQALKIMIYYANQQSTRDFNGPEDATFAQVASGRNSESVANSRLRTIISQHFMNNSWVEQAVRVQNPSDLIEIDQQRILRIVERVARRDWNLDDLTRYVRGKAAEKVEGDMPFSHLEKHEVDAIVKHSAYLGYVRLHNQGEYCALALTEAGSKLLIEQGSSVHASALQPSISWNELKTRIGHFTERHTLEMALTPWSRRSYLGRVKNQDQLRDALKDFNTQEFLIADTKVSGQLLTQQFCQREKTNLADSRALLSYILGTDPLLAGKLIIN